MSKKKSLFSSSGGSVELGTPLIMEVSTTDRSRAKSPTDSIILPFVKRNTVNLQIDWGDGSALEPYTDTDLKCIHKYAVGGFYDIKIYNLDGVSRIPWNITNVPNNRQDNSKFYDLKQFGDCEIYQLDEFDAGSFDRCIRLDISATDIKERCIDLTIEARSLFQFCLIVEAKNSSNWDTSGIVFWESTFASNRNIIIDCSNWEMSQTQSITRIFASCDSINPDVTNWDISSNCKNLDQSFYNTAIERNLSNWDVSGVTTMKSTFYSCTSFTGQGLDTWVTSALIDLTETLESCTSLTTVNLSSWDVSGVTTMNSTFRSCTNFVGNGLDSWVTTSVLKSLVQTFQNCTNFNGNLQNFDVSGVTTMSRTFNGCTNFVGNGLDSWATSSALTNLLSTFENGTLFNADLSSWNVSGVTSITSTFSGCTNFVGNGLNLWATSSLLSLNQTFENCTSFNQDLSGWDFSNVIGMRDWGSNWAMDTNNYDKLLLSFASQTLKPNLTSVVMSSKYTAGEVTNGVTDSIATNKLIDSTQNFTSTVNVGDVIKNGTTYAEVVTVDSNTELTLDADIMALGDSYSVEGSDVAKARYFVVKTYNWEIIDDGQA